jgi:hypothetical protein
MFDAKTFASVLGGKFKKNQTFTKKAVSILRTYKLRKFLTSNIIKCTQIF